MVERLKRTERSAAVKRLEPGYCLGYEGFEQLKHLERLERLELTHPRHPLTAAMLMMFPQLRKREGMAQDQKCSGIVKPMTAA
jgi:hypothetical protein